MGITDRGFFHEQFVSVPEEGSFDHGNAENRLTSFLQSTSAIAKEVKKKKKSIIEPRAKEITHERNYRTDWGDQERYDSKKLEVPLESFGFVSSLI